MPTLAETLAEGWKLQQAGRLAPAEQLYRQVLKAQPTDPNAWCYLGMVLHDQERYDQAVGAYRRALAIQPEFPVCYNNLGNTYRLLRQLDQALVAFDKA